MSTFNGKNGKKAKLVILFGNEEGKSFSPFHALIRNMIWSILWFLNGLLVKSTKEIGEAKIASEGSLLRKVIRMATMIGAEDAIEKAKVEMVHLVMADKPELKEALIETAQALSLGRSYVSPLRFDETGKPETAEQAAARLIRTAVLHPNKVVGGAYRNYRDGLVKAKAISVAAAKKASDAAVKERDDAAKAKAAKAKVEPKKEEKKK